MSPSWKRALTILLVLLTLVVTGLMLAAWTMLPLDQTALTIDGDRFSLADLAGMDAVVFFVIAVAAVVFAVALAILVGVVGLAFALAVAIGSLALVASPLLLCAWMLWRLVRARPAAPGVVRA